jgi:cytochrome c553
MKKIFALLALAGVAHFAAAADTTGNAKAADNKVAMCIGCHGIPGYKATFPEVYSVPMIGGQSAKYIESALNAYKKGERKHPSMRGVAAGLSDQDIADIAAYYSQQK